MLKLKPRPGKDGIIWWHIGGQNRNKVKIDRHSTGFSDHALAEKYRDKLESATQWPLPQPAPAPQPKPRLTFAEALERWIESLPVPDDSTSRRTYRSSVSNGFIRPVAELFPKLALLDEITSEHLNALQNYWRRENFKLNCKQTYRDQIGMMFKWARDHEYIPLNPWKVGVNRLKPVKQSKRQIMKREAKDEGHATLPLDTDEGKTNWLRIRAAVPDFVEKRCAKRENLMFHTPGVWMALLDVMYELGLRRSDATLFRPDWIETTEHGGSYFAQQWKTGDPVTCYLPKDLMETLRGLPLLPWRGAPSEYEELAEKPFVPGVGLYPFYTGSGGELADYMETNLNAPLRILGEMLGGFEVQKGKSLRPHRFRDSFAVNMLNLGLSLQDISKMLGHKRLSTTEDSYTPFVISVSKAIERRQFAARQAKLFEEANEAPRAIEGWKLAMAA